MFSWFSYLTLILFHLHELCPHETKHFSFVKMFVSIFIRWKFSGRFMKRSHVKWKTCFQCFKVSARLRGILHLKLLFSSARHSRNLTHNHTTSKYKKFILGWCWTWHYELSFLLRGFSCYFLNIWWAFALSSLSFESSRLVLRVGKVLSNGIRIYYEIFSTLVFFWQIRNLFNSVNAIS